MDAQAPIPLTAASEDLQKVLHKVGYPEVEEGEKPSALLPKCITCLTKRIKRLGDLAKSLAPDPQVAANPKASAADKQSAEEKQRISWAPRMLGVNSYRDQLQSCPTHPKYCTT